MTRRQSSPDPGLIHHVATGELGFHNVTTDDGAWVTGTLREVNGRMLLQKLCFEIAAEDLADPAGEITSSTLRKVRLDEVMGAVRRAAAAAGQRGERRLEHPEQAALSAKRGYPPDIDRAIVRMGRSAAKMQPAGRRGWSDDFYRMVALEYVRLTEAGVPGRGALPRLAQKLAKRMGEAEPRHRDNVRDWVAEARRRGFLLPVGRGRGGAVPGPRLYDNEGEK